MGSFPFFDLLRTAFASIRVVPDGAVTRSVDMTVVTGSSRAGWNCMSRVVIIPINFDRSVPFSVSVSVSAGSHSAIQWLQKIFKTRNLYQKYLNVFLVATESLWMNES